MVLWSLQSRGLGVRPGFGRPSDKWYNLGCGTEDLLGLLDFVGESQPYKDFRGGIGL